MGLTVEEFEPAPALSGVVHGAADFHERGAAPLRRLESPLAGVLIVSLGPDMEIDGRATGSFVAGVWDRPTVTGHYGEQAGYQLYLDLIDARRLLASPEPSSRIGWFRPKTSWTVARAARAPREH